MEGQQPEDPVKRNIFDEQGRLTSTEPPNPELSHTKTSRYREWDHTSHKVCNDCGCIVSNTAFHDEFHESVGT